MRVHNVKAAGAAQRTGGRGERPRAGRKLDQLDFCLADRLQRADLIAHERAAARMGVVGLHVRDDQRAQGSPDRSALE